MCYGRMGNKHLSLDYRDNNDLGFSFDPGEVHNN